VNLVSRPKTRAQILVENSVLRRITELMREEVRREWKKLHYYEPYDVFFTKY
jgi:hypothetical protein